MTTEAKTCLPSAKKSSYVDSFKMHFDVVYSITKEQNKGLADFVSIISQRLECETQYSKELNRVASLKCRLNLGYLLLC